MNPKFRLSLTDFLDYAPQNLDETVHIHHCKQGPGNDRLYITRTSDNTVLAYCHHCTARGFHHATRGRTRRERVNKNKGKKQPFTPHGGTTSLSEWSPRAKAWVSAAYIGQELITKFQLRHLLTQDAVIIDIKSNEKIVRSILRSFENNAAAKYLTLSHDNFADASAYVYPSANTTRANCVVICEDVLSAIRISTDTACDALPILGTSLARPLLAHIAKSPAYRDAVVFLDDDNYFVRKQQREIRRDILTFCDLQTRIIRIGKDPKRMSPTELRDLLS